MCHQIARATPELFSFPLAKLDSAECRPAAEARTSSDASADAAIAILSCRFSCRQSRGGRCLSCGRRCADDQADGRAQPRLPPIVSTNSPDRLRSRTQRLHSKISAPLAHNRPDRFRRSQRKESGTGRLRDRESAVVPRANVSRLLARCVRSSRSPGPAKITL